MAQLSYANLRFIERLFIRSGYVLDFFNATFADFFESEVGVEIYDPRYETNGTSKGNRLRTFLKVDDNATVALWDYRQESLGSKHESGDSEARIRQIIRELSPSEISLVAEPPPVINVLGRGTPNSPSPAPLASEAAISALASYAHQNERYNKRVLEQVNRLRGDGIDCWSDHFEIFPKEGWPAWMHRQLSDRRWILVFASETYKRRADGREQAGHGLGVIWEHGAIRRELYEKGKINERFIPVGFGPRNTTEIPSDLQDYTYFNLDEESDYQRLLSVLRSDPLIKPHPLGQRVTSGGTTPNVTPAAPVDESHADVLSGEGTKPTKRQSSTVFFSDRFAQAFPGVRGVSWFPGRVAVERLAILLERPLSFRVPDGGEYEPIWYRELGNLGIERFSIESDSRVLINVHEWDIDKVAAVNMGNYWQKFVYVQTHASAPTGLYDDAGPSDSVGPLRYRSEEFGIVGGHLVTRAEYDDRAAVIDGKPIDIRDSVELRVRYLTPYNFVIAAHNSPFNSEAFDRVGGDFLEQIREGKSTVEDPAKFMLRVPKRQPMRYEFP